MTDKKKLLKIEGIPVGEVILSKGINPKTKKEFVYISNLLLWDGEATFANLSLIYNNFNMGEDGENNG